jgi:hypothetical protein
MEPGSADCSSIRTTLDDDDCDAESERSVGVLGVIQLGCQGAKACAQTDTKHQLSVKSSPLLLALWGLGRGRGRSREEHGTLISRLFLDFPPRAPPRRGCRFSAFCEVQTTFCPTESASEDTAGPVGSGSGSMGRRWEAS